MALACASCQPGGPLHIAGRCFHFSESWDQADEDDWTDDCCFEQATEDEMLDLYAPFSGRIFILADPTWLQAELNGLDPDDPNELAEGVRLDSPTSDQLPGDGEFLRSLYSYLGGSRADGRTCSYFEPGERPAAPWTLADLPEERGILALVNDANNVILILDHAEWCWTYTDGTLPVTVAAGTRIGRLSKHGITEVAMWVNDRGDRWRAMSYFDALPDDLYALYNDNNAATTQPMEHFGFAARGQVGVGTPSIPLHERDLCPLEPNESCPVVDPPPPTATCEGFNQHPDFPPIRQVCHPVQSNLNPPMNDADCAGTCPPDWLWQNGLPTPPVQQ